ncbi:MAG: HAMP domain-containing histidine kinase [Candidatus Delongbacteria bacterium]|nr:HAMP domain-containing histidine kinase [Candidatus Delongbacteria bacterium]
MKYRFRLSLIIYLIILITIIFIIRSIVIAKQGFQDLAVQTKDILLAESVSEIKHHSRFGLIACGPGKTITNIYALDTKTMKINQREISASITCSINEGTTNFFYDDINHKILLPCYDDESTYCIYEVNDDESLNSRKIQFYDYEEINDLKQDFLYCKSIKFYNYHYVDDQEQKDFYKIENYKDGYRLIFNKSFYYKLDNQYIVSDHEVNPIFREASLYLTYYFGIEFNINDAFKIYMHSLRNRYYNKTYFSNQTEAKKGFLNCEILGSADLNNDHIGDYIVQIEGNRFLATKLICLNGKNYDILWERELLGNLYQKKIEFADIDQDGTLELMLSYYSPMNEIPIDSFEKDYLGNNFKTQFIILTNEGQIKQIEDRPAIVQYRKGYHYYNHEYSKANNAVLLGLESNHDNEIKYLLSYDLTDNTLDTLEIEYQNIFKIYEENSEIIVFDSQDDKLVKFVLDDNFNLKNTYSLGINYKFEKCADNTVEINNREYHVLKWIKPFIIDQKLKSYYPIDMVFDDYYIVVKENSNFLINRINGRHYLVKLKILPLENYQFNYLIIVLLIEIILLLIYYMIRYYFKLPYDSVKESYFIQYSVLGILHYCSLKGFLKNFYSLPKVICFNEKTPKTILKQISTQTEPVYQKRNLLGKFQIFKISSQNEYQIFQRISHELKNQIYLLKLTIDNYSEMFKTQNSKFAVEIETSLKQITNSSKTLSDFSHINKPFYELVDLNEYILDVIQIFINHDLYDKIEFVQRNISINYKVDKVLFKIALINFLNNALEAIDGDGKVTVEIFSNEFEIHLVFRNTIPNKMIDLNKIKEIGYSTKESGSGIGIPISQKIIEKHNGRFEIYIDDSEFVIDIVLIEDKNGYDFDS